MFLPPLTLSLAVRGRAGGITRGSTYFRTESGSSVPPGSGIAKTRSAPKRAIRKLPALVTLSLRKTRRLSIGNPRSAHLSPQPPGYAFGSRSSVRCPTRDGEASMTLPALERALVESALLFSALEEGHQPLRHTSPAAPLRLAQHLVQQRASLHDRLMHRRHSRRASRLLRVARPASPFGI